MGVCKYVYNVYVHVCICVYVCMGYRRENFSITNVATHPWEKAQKSRGAQRKVCTRRSPALQPIVEYIGYFAPLCRYVLVSVGQDYKRQIFENVLRPDRRTHRRILDSERDIRGANFHFPSKNSKPVFGWVGTVEN